MNCKICSSQSPLFAFSMIINKYRVAYFRCAVCGFVQTEEPYWLNEAYSNAINRSDIGLVSRNLALAKISKAIICTFFNQNGRFLDYAGGCGLFVRIMRDYGLDFYWYDKYCNNLFAKGFEAEINGGRFEVVSAFEVFEHLVNPMDDIREMLAFTRNILFTTELLPADAPKPDEWWYYGLDHGQHISFYTLKSLSIIADNLSLNLYSNGASIHLLTSKKISPILFNIVSMYKVASLFNIAFNKKSRIPEDYLKITGKQLS